MRLKLLSLLLLAATPAAAQQADAAAIAAQRAAMAKLDAMDGAWRGEAVHRGPGGEQRVTQTERVGSFLDGTIKLVEGHGFMPDGTTGFHAFAVISFDAATGKYVMRSHAQGRAGSFEVKPTATGFEWEIPAGPAVIRYVATIGGGKWRETGEYVAPGQPPRPFFEMNLVRLGDTGWPGAGAIGPK